MKKKVIGLLVVAVLTIFTMFIIKYFCGNDSKLEEKVEHVNKKKKILIGKKIYINVPEKMIVDVSLIQKVLNEEIEYEEHFFDMIYEDALNELMNYMSTNNLVIKPGFYILNQAWSGEKIIEALEFRKI